MTQPKVLLQPIFDGQVQFLHIIGKIASTIHPYPTQGEVIKKAGDTWRRGKLTPMVQRIFEIFFRIFR